MNLCISLPSLSLLFDLIYEEQFIPFQGTVEGRNWLRGDLYY